jgi:hypothetical protein
MDEAARKVKQWVPGSPLDIYSDPNTGRNNPMDESMRSVSVLNRNTTFNLSDYEKVMLGKESERLQEYGRQANFDLKRMMDSRRFYNLSLAEIAQRTVLTVIAVFVDLLNYFRPEEKEKREGLSFGEKANRFAGIFVAKERIMYVGVFFVLLSALFMVIFLSS